MNRQQLHRAWIRFGGDILQFVGFAGMLLFTIFLQPYQAAGQKMAFFPLLDLTKDNNGINMELTSRMHRELAALGYQLIGEDEIMSFLVRHRIRRLGQLNDFQNTLVRKELAADLLLQGTVCQVSRQQNLALSINLLLSRTSDSQVVWGRTHTVSSLDLISLLGINDPDKLDDMLEIFFTELFTGMPGEFEPGDDKHDRFGIASVAIRPMYLRAGEKVTCTIKLNLPFKEADHPTLSLQVDGQVFPLTIDEESSSLQASWVAEQDEGSYPVTLLAQWSKTDKDSRIIGTYSVDVREPGATLEVVGKEYDNKIMFSDKLVIIPRLIDPEPITRWQIEVFDEEDIAVVTMGESGQIPRNLTWQGKTSLGNMAEPGEYRIVFRVWDRAERTSSAEIKTWYLPEPPEFLVDVVQQEKKISVGVDNSTETPLSFWWVKFYRQDGSLLKLAQGITLPVDIELETDIALDEKIECLLSARDILGNHSRQRIANVLTFADTESDVEVQKTESEWVEEF